MREYEGGKRRGADGRRGKGAGAERLASSQTRLDNGAAEEQGRIKSP